MQCQHEVQRALTVMAATMAARRLSATCRLMRPNSGPRSVRSISIVKASMSDDQSSVEVNFDDGQKGVFHNLWLR